MAAPERRIRETNPHFRVAEHVAVMAKVRRAENTVPRMSCEGYRNLEPTCPNLLPDNKPEDFEPPRDRGDNKTARDRSRAVRRRRLGPHYSAGSIARSSSTGKASMASSRLAVSSASRLAAIFCRFRR